MTFTINGSELCIEKLDKPNDLHYGTKSSTGYKGAVAFYSVDDGEELDWFVYADANHAAVWSSERLRGNSAGWSGDAYSK